MEHYCCGFMFNPERTQVVLIEKLRPQWQYKKFNGVGGHIEEGETPEEAMSREFEEEANLPNTKWERILEYSVFAEKNLVAKVYFFRSFGSFVGICTRTAEKIFVCNIDEINSMNVLKKIKFLVPLCLNDDIIFPIKMSGARDS